MHFCWMRIIVSFSIAVVLLLCGCGGPNDSIGLVGYPKNSFSGRNILHESVSELDSTKTYSMIVQIERGQVLKVILKNESDSLPQTKEDLKSYRWWAEADLNTGWYIEDYDITTHSQTFYAEGPASPHLTLDFLGCGLMTVEVYETEVQGLTSTKTVDWTGFCDN